MTAPHADRDGSEAPRVHPDTLAWTHRGEWFGVHDAVRDRSEAPTWHDPVRRLARYGEAVTRILGDFDTVMNVKHEGRAIAQRVMAVADAEQAELRAEIADRESERADLRDRLDKAEAEVERLRIAAAREHDMRRISEGSLTLEREKVARVEALREKVVRYRKACNDSLNRRWNDTDLGARLACDYMLQEWDNTAIAGPMPETRRFCRLPACGCDGAEHAI